MKKTIGVSEILHEKIKAELIYRQECEIPRPTMESLIFDMWSAYQARKGENYEEKILLYKEQ